MEHAQMDNEQIQVRAFDIRASHFRHLYRRLHNLKKSVRHRLNIELDNH